MQTKMIDKLRFIEQMCSHKRKLSIRRNVILSASELFVRWGTNRAKSEEQSDEGISDGLDLPFWKQINIFNKRLLQSVYFYRREILR